VVKVPRRGYRALMAYASTLLARRYVLDERIGAGGYCEVWRATDTVLSRPVAVKLLHAGYASHGEALARFNAEARHAGALSHPNIARVYDYGEPAEEQSYLVMELVDGPSLADLLTRGPLGPAQTMDMVAQVAAGLQAAHAVGLIHRDIKPANILFTSGGSVRITDFGIAHVVGSTPVTSTGTVMGTPGYIAPERVAGASAGPASDLYALGIVAYECLTGTQPFAGGALDVAIAHRDRPLPPLPASVPSGVAAFVMTLTAKDPAWRPADAGQAADQAARLRDELLSPRDSAPAAPVAVPPGAPPTVPDSMLALGFRPSRRRPLTVAVVTLAALTCLVLISIIGFAPGSRPVRPSSQTPSHTPAAASSRAAQASTPSPSGAPSPSGVASASHPASPSASPSGSPDASTTASSSPGKDHHKKGRGNGNG
jgi:eukaryotic-like serine/threonine-protein kinase